MIIDADTGRHKARDKNLYDVHRLPPFPFRLSVRLTPVGARRADVRRGDGGKGGVNSQLMTHRTSLG